MQGGEDFVASQAERLQTPAIGADYLLVTFNFGFGLTAEVYLTADASNWVNNVYYPSSTRVNVKVDVGSN